MNELRDASDSATPTAVALSRPQGFGGGRELAAVGVSYLILAVEVTIRLWADPASRIVAGNPGDADQVSWFFRYAAEAIAHLRLPAMTSTGLGAPQGFSLMGNPSSLFLGVLLAPVTLLAGPQPSLTAALTLGFAGSALAMFAVLRRNGCTTGPAFLAGAVYGFSPALIHSAINHFDLQFAVFPPLIADAALRILTNWTAGGRGAQLRRGAWLGLLCAAQVLTNEEVLLDTAIAVAVFAVVLAASRPAMVIPRLRDAAASLAAGLATFTVVAAYPLWTQFFGPLRQSGPPFILSSFYKNDLDGLVQPSALQLFHTASTAAFAGTHRAGLPEYLGYLGWPMLVALLVATVAFWRVLAVRMTAVAFVVLEVFSLGGTLSLGGEDHLWLKLPWYWLQGLPLAGFVVADRFSIIADGAAAALLGFALQAAWRIAAAARRDESPDDESPDPAPRAVPPGLSARAGAAAVAVALCVAIVPLIPVALPAQLAPGVPPGWTTAYRALDLPAGANVLTVPVPTPSFPEPMRWYADTAVPSAMVGGYIMAPASSENELGSEAQYLNQLWVESGGGTWAGPAGTGGIPLTASAPDDRDARQQIDGWRLGAVMAVTNPGSPLAVYLTRLLGKPVVSAGAVLGWQLGAPNRSGS
jgi:hypothetical protein